MVVVIRFALYLKMNGSGFKIEDDLLEWMVMSFGVFMPLVLL